MKKLSLCSLFGIAMLSLASHASALAENYTGGVTIGRMWIDGTGVWIGTNIKPNKCFDNFNSTYFLLKAASPNYKNYLALLLSAKATGSTIDLWFQARDAAVSCNDYTGVNMLVVEGAGYSN